MQLETARMIVIRNDELIAMNLKKLKVAEQRFLSRHPGGFHSPDMQAIAKKHKIEKLVAFAQTAFAKACFKDTDKIVKSAIKLVSQSSMVSIFEKPKFRDYVASLDATGKQRFANSLKAQLHGAQAKGFDTMLELLGEAKLAKWTLLTVLPFYFKPDTEVFIKPTTTKGVISTFELEGLSYHATPSFEFYEKYRAHIMAMKAALIPDLGPNNAAFCGFLMMSLEA